jgi:uncharacterized protein
MNQKEGELAVKIARDAIEMWVTDEKTLPAPKDLPESFRTMRGVFTTLSTHPSGELRGCIGYPYPILPLVTAIIKSSIEATKDPRFPDLELEELDLVTVEVSILTEPELIKVKKPEEYLKKIEIGEDGLMIKADFSSGLLLPQVAVEHEWDAKTFLENLCWKAGLDQNAWKSKSVEVYKFHAEIFHEEEPDGKIVRA